MPNEILHTKVGLCLYFETGSDGGIGCEAYSIGCHNHRILFLDVVGIVDQATKIVSGMYLCYHSLSFTYSY